MFNLGQNWNNFWTVLICFNNNFNWKWQILNLIHWERLKLVPDLLLNFQVTLDRLILFLMQICLLEFVTFIDLSELAEPCSLSWQLENFKELSKMYLGQILLRRSLPHHLTNPLFAFWPYCDLLTDTTGQLKSHRCSNRVNYLFLKPNFWPHCAQATKPKIPPLRNQLLLHSNAIALFFCNWKLSLLSHNTSRCYSIL